MAAAQPERLTALDLVGSALAGRQESFAVTGATGWFGATALDLLYGALGDDAPTRVTAYASAERTVVVGDGRRVAVRPLSDLLQARPSPSVLMHFAYLTRDKVAELGTQEYVTRNVALSASVLEAVRRLRPRHVIVASSGAVYATDGGLARDVVADPYGSLKRLDELAFRAAADEVGATCVVPRVFSVAGPHMTKPEKYALGDMLATARAGRPVFVRAAGPVYRSYCGVDEVVALSLWASLRGMSLTFDSGGTVVEMSELAATVASVAGGRLVQRASFDPGLPADRYCGDPGPMAALAREAGLRMRDLPELLRATTWPGSAPARPTP